MGFPRGRIAQVIPAWASAAGFTVLACVLAATGRLPFADAMWASAAVLAAHLPSGWCGPVGWHRRVAEVALLPAACTLMLTADLTLRRMLLPPLLVLAAAAVVLAAMYRAPERARPVLIGSLALAVQAAAGVGLAGAGLVPSALVLACAAVSAWAASFWGPAIGVTIALVLGALPLVRWPSVTVLLAVLAVWLYPWGRSSAILNRALSGWMPVLAGGALVGIALAPWGRIPLGWAFPEAGPLGVAILVLTLLVTARLPPAVAGAIWFVALIALGPVQQTSPERRSIRLPAGDGEIELPAGSGDRYLIDLALWGARDLPLGLDLATLDVDGESRTLRVGIDAVDAGHQLSDSGGPVRHPIPRRSVWRPLRVGCDARWRVAARLEIPVADGERPTLRRDPALPENARIIVETAGPVRPTPPRDWQLPIWLWATAAVVALLQLFGGWRSWTAVVPWSLLAAGQIAARAWVVPLRLVGERYAVDICLAALLAAWLPCAWRWLVDGRPFRAAVTLLLPLALAVPHLTPPLFGDEPFHLVVMESLVSDRDLDVSNNIDPESTAGHRQYSLGKPLLHSPALGILLLPGYLVAGRAGAVVLFAFAGAGLVWLMTVLARRLGVPEHRLVLLILAVIVSYPLVTYTTQIWPELPGALAVAAVLVAVELRGGGILAIGAALTATVVKTRLALLTFPVAAVRLAGADPRRRVLGLLGLAAAAAAALAVGWLTMGHPFGYFRRAEDLVPTDPLLALRVIGGLLFDHAGGLAFAAPLLLIAVLSSGLLWRRGGPGERAALVGGGLTVLALLPSIEWYGGGAPPARYLIPLLPVLVLTLGLVLRTPLRWRRLLEPLLPGSLFVWWALVSRPHFSVNPGDGGWWLSDALARRFAADTQQFFPSFLVPTTATLWFPAVVVVIAIGVVWLTARRSGAARSLVRVGFAVWLVCAAGLAAAVSTRCDRVVEVEAPQVRRRGGVPVPGVGTHSRFAHRMGWQVADQEGVIVPLNLARGVSVWLEGWLVGNAQKGAELMVSWDDGTVTTIRVKGEGRDARVRLPAPPGHGRHRLRIFVRSPWAGAAVLDRVVMTR